MNYRNANYSWIVVGAYYSCSLTKAEREEYARQAVHVVGSTDTVGKRSQRSTANLKIKYKRKHTATVLKYRRSKMYPSTRKRRAAGVSQRSLR